MQHIVLWQFKPEVTLAQSQNILSRFSDYLNSIEYIRHIVVGQVDEIHSDDIVEITHGFTFEFDSKADLQQFFDDENGKALKDELIGLIENEQVGLTAFNLITDKELRPA